MLWTNKRKDRIRKKRVYHRHRVSHDWLLDPGEEALLVYCWASEGSLEVLAAQGGERVRVEPFEAI